VRARAKPENNKQKKPMHFFFELFFFLFLFLNRLKVTEMFYHGYNNFLLHAFPKDELQPLSCMGHETLGG
jgi:hypothetical protein